MDMRNVESVREKLCRELAELSHDGEMSPGEVDAAYKIMSAIKNSYKIEMCEDGGYSRSGSWTADMRGEYGNSYNDGYSNRHYVRGHYSRDGGPGGGYSGRRGYSRAGDMPDQDMR